MKRRLALVAVVTMAAAACGDAAEVTPTGAAATADPATEAPATTMADGMGNSHTHGMQEWEGEPVPTVAVEAVADSVSGVNVFATVTDYRFAPENASAGHIAGEGHAHLYVDGSKLGRVYGTAYHIKGLAPGTHEITYTLSANTHDDYMANGEPLSASVTVEVGESVHMHGHEPREWDGGALNASVEVAKDAKAGWNLTAQIEGFTITPEAVGSEHIPGEGHLHLYVNGVKKGRVYTTAFHIMELPAGTIEIALRFSGNDHAEYVRDGEPVEVVTTVEISQEDGSSAAPATTMAHGEMADVVIEAAFADGAVSVESDRVEVETGEMVSITVTSDVAEELHVHGYDLYADLEPGVPATLIFTADIPGIFEVEFEDSGRLLFELEVS